MTSENSRVTTKILVLLLIGQRCTTNQKHFEGLSQSSDRLLVRNFCARFSDVYNQWWRHKIPAVFSHFLKAATKFHVAPPTKNVSFVFSLSLQLFFSLSFAGLSPYFLFFSVFLFTFYIPNFRA